MKTLVSDPDSLDMLDPDTDPDTDPDSMNPNPQL
jgi:hypothetical protein